MKKQLGEILLQEGVITKEDLQEVLKIQKKSPLKLGQILQKKGLADEDQILKTLANQFGYEYESRLTFKFDDAFKKIPVNLLQKAKMVPVSRTGKSIKVALSDPADLHPAVAPRALPRSGHRLRGHQREEERASLNQATQGHRQMAHA